MRRGPAKPRILIKVVECGSGRWDEADHGLDYPATIHTTDFKVTGRGHHRIEELYRQGCREIGRRLPAYSEDQAEQRIAMWLCQHASCFVMIDTKSRATVIGLQLDEEAELFREEFTKRSGVRS